MFSRTPSAGKIDFGRPVAAERQDAGVESLARAAGAHRFAVASHLAVGVLYAAQGAQHLALAVALGAGEAENFAAADVKRHVAEARAAEAADRQHDLGRPARRSLRIFRLDRAADHHGDEVVLGEPVVDLVGAPALAVAQDGYAVGKGEDLRQAMADIDHRGAAGDGAPDDAAQLFDA